ncbi:MAG: Na+/H+ antiporter subunit E [Thioalkalivibrionaceae bacterium]
MTPLTWNLLLALLWAALTGNFSGVNLLVGFIFGYLALAIGLRELPGVRSYLKRVPKVIGFILFFFKELIVSNLKVAWDVVTPTHLMSPGVIAFPLTVRTDAEITTLANLISLTPGTLSLDVSSDKKVLYIHVMYLDDRSAVFASIHDLERRILEMMR